MELLQSQADFEATQWSLVRSFREGDTATAKAALDSLCAAYWPPVYGYLRRMGYDRDRAADVTQGFFADVVLWRESFAKADQSRGKLRSLMLTSLHNFLIDQHRRSSARPVERTVAESMLDGGCASAGGADDSPELGFDTRWATSLLQSSLERCERHFRSTNRERHWQAFELRVLQPLLNHVEVPSYRQVVSLAGFESTAEATAAVDVVKKRLGALLKATVAETVADAKDAEAEWEYVVSLLS